MLIKVTNYCSMGCSHCMEDSTIKGAHMDEETFVQALRFTMQAESLAWASGCPPLLLLSGGECTEHPDIEKYIQMATDWGFKVLLITNGMWLNDPRLKASLLRPEWRLFIQVTNDPRYYPKAPPRIEHPQITYIDALTLLLPLGRAARKKAEQSIPTRKAPTSFNIRSMTRHFGSFEEALAVHRQRAMTSSGGHCSPSVSSNGDVMAGESANCFKIGTVYSTNSEITKALKEMTCNACGLVDNLSPAEKRAIGESVLFGASE